MIVVVDADGLIGILNKEDAHYTSSIKLLRKLQKLGSTFVYPASAVAEASAVLQVRLNKPEAADQILELVKSKDLDVEPIDQESIINAAAFLSNPKSKHATLFDGIVAAVAQKYKADAIFSFDHFYKNKGFKLASEI